MPYIGKSSCESEAAALGVRTKEHTGCMGETCGSINPLCATGLVRQLLLSLSFAILKVAQDHLCNFHIYLISAASTQLLPCRYKCCSTEGKASPEQVLQL